MKSINADDFIRGTHRLDQVKSDLELLVRGLMGLMPHVEDNWIKTFTIPKSEGRWVLGKSSAWGLFVEYELPRFFATSAHRQYISVYGQYARPVDGKKAVEETESIELAYAARQVLADGISQMWPALLESPKMQAILAAGTVGPTNDG